MTDRNHRVGYEIVELECEVVDKQGKTICRSKLEKRFEQLEFAAVPEDFKFSCQDGYAFAQMKYKRGEHPLYDVPVEAIGKIRYMLDTLPDCAPITGKERFRFVFDDGAEKVIEMNLHGEHVSWT